MLNGNTSLGRGGDHQKQMERKDRSLNVSTSTWPGHKNKKYFDVKLESMNRHGQNTARNRRTTTKTGMELIFMKPQNANSWLWPQTSAKQQALKWNKLRLRTPQKTASCIFLVIIYVLQWQRRLQNHCQDLIFLGNNLLPEVLVSLTWRSAWSYSCPHSQKKPERCKEGMKRFNLSFT